MNNVTIEVGYGTTTVVYTRNAKPVAITFPSTPKRLLQSRSHIGGLGMADRKNVTIEVNGSLWEVGQDTDKINTGDTKRVLSDSFVESDYYMAILKGCLAMLPKEISEITNLTLGLPVNRMHLEDKLIAIAKQTHQIGTASSRKVKVKNVIVCAQPLGTLLYYAMTNKAQMQSIAHDNFLVLDPGYLTLDKLVTTGLYPDESQSGAVDYGMSKVLRTVQDALYAKIGDQPDIEQLDKAFYSDNQSFICDGRRWDFPINKKHGVNYNMRPLIDSIIGEGIDLIKTGLDDAKHINRILIGGGPTPWYAPIVKDRFPKHQVDIVDNPLQAVAIGMHLGTEYKTRKSLKKAS